VDEKMKRTVPDHSPHKTKNYLVEKVIEAAKCKINPNPLIVNARII